MNLDLPGLIAQRSTTPQLMFHAPRMVQKLYRPGTNSSHTEFKNSHMHKTKKGLNKTKEMKPLPMAKTIQNYRENFFFKIQNTQNHDAVKQFLGKNDIQITKNATFCSSNPILKSGSVNIIKFAPLLSQRAKQIYKKPPSKIIVDSAATISPEKRYTDVLKSLAIVTTRNSNMPSLFIVTPRSKLNNASNIISKSKKNENVMYRTFNNINMNDLKNSKIAINKYPKGIIRADCLMTHLNEYMINSVSTLKKTECPIQIISENERKSTPKPERKITPKPQKKVRIKENKKNKFEKNNNLDISEIESVHPENEDLNEIEGDMKNMLNLIEDNKDTK